MIDAGHPTVMIVDDSQINRIILEEGLAEAGLRTVSASDGAEALMLISADQERPEGAARPRFAALPRFDAVILDIMMPGIDGLEVLAKIRERYSSLDLPVIMATAKDRSCDIVNALEEGANDYVTKPFDMPVLLARLATHLNLKRSHAALRDMQRSFIHAAKMETIGHLASGVAHEIRNPLAQMQLAADGLSRIDALQNDASATTLRDLMNDAIDRADAIVRRLMDFSDSSALKLAEGSLNQLVEETIEVLEPELDGRSIRVRLDLEQPPPIVLMAADELQRALIHVVMNALQSMDAKGGGDLRIRTGTRTLDGQPQSHGRRGGNRPRNGDLVGIVEVIDTGSGIADNVMDSIYDAFFSTKPTGTATGIGLTFARKVIDLHEGLIEVRNRRQQTGVRARLSLKVPGSFSTTV